MLLVHFHKLELFWQRAVTTHLTNMLHACQLLITFHLMMKETHLISNNVLLRSLWKWFLCWDFGKAAVLIIICIFFLWSFCICAHILTLSQRAISCVCFLEPIILLHQRLGWQSHPMMHCTLSHWSLALLVIVLPISGAPPAIFPLLPHLPLKAKAEELEEWKGSSCC